MHPNKIKMIYQSQQLLNEMKERTEGIIQTVESQFIPLPLESLNWKATETSWSILECLEHLNRYGVYYLPVLKKKIKPSKPIQSSTEFKCGWLGNYFAEMMLPPTGAIKPMATLKSMNPNGSSLDISILHTFLDQQKEWLKLIETARKSDLQGIRLPISVTKWIRLKLGDTFRFNIYHNQRHIIQAEKVLENLGNTV